MRRQPGIFPAARRGLPSFPAHAAALFPAPCAVRRPPEPRICPAQDRERPAADRSRSCGRSKSNAAFPANLQALWVVAAAPVSGRISSGPGAGEPRVLEETVSSAPSTASTPPRPSVPAKRDPPARLLRRGTALQGRPPPTAPCRCRNPPHAPQAGRRERPPPPTASSRLRRRSRPGEMRERAKPFFLAGGRAAPHVFSASRS